MKKGIIVGKSVRTYEKDGEKKVSSTLHILWDKQERQEEGETGQKVEAMWVRFPVNDIMVGDYVGFEYDIVPGAKGSMAILSEIKVLGKAKINIELPKVV